MSKIRNFLSKFKKNKVDKTSLEYEDQDLTGEVQIESDDSEHTSEIQVQTAQMDEDNEYDFDLGQKLTFKDKIEAVGNKIKDSFAKINFKRFKVISAKEIGEKSGLNKVDFSKFQNKVSKIDISKFYNQIFASEYRTPINKTFLFSTLLIVTYLIGSSISRLITPSNGNKIKNSVANLKLDYSKELSKQMVTSVKMAKLFKTESIQVNDGKEIKPIKEVEIICKEATRNSSLPIKLINTIVLQDTVKSIASVQVRNSELQNVREGDKIESMAEVGKIDRLGLIIKNLKDGSCEKIASNDYEPPSRNSTVTVLSPTQSKKFIQNKKISGIKNDGNSFTIQKSFLEEKMSDIANVITQARGIQITNPDGTLSFKIVDIDPGGVFAYLGIQNNDVITNINGNKINDLNEVMSLFSKITTIDQLKLTVTRGGSEVPLEYKFK